MTCSNCQHKNSLNAKFCEECGTPQKRICHQCQHSNKPTAKFCAECGDDLLSTKDGEKSKTISYY